MSAFDPKRTLGRWFARCDPGCREGVRAVPELLQTLYIGAGSGINLRLSCFQRFFTNEAETAREAPQCLLFQRLHVSDATGRGRHEDALRQFPLYQRGLGFSG